MDHIISYQSGRPKAATAANYLMAVVPVYISLSRIIIREVVNFSDKLYVEDATVNEESLDRFFYKAKNQRIGEKSLVTKGNYLCIQTIPF